MDLNGFKQPNDEQKDFHYLINDGKIQNSSIFSEICWDAF